MTVTAHPVGGGMPAARPARTFWAMLIRDAHVLRQDFVSFMVRTLLQPTLLFFLFTYVLPKIGSGIGPTLDVRKSTASTILAPGLIANAVLMTGLVAVTQPLVMELSYTKEIEDRLLAPIPTWILGVQKIVSGSVQALIGGAVMFPIVYFLHSAGQGPALHVGNWGMLLVVVVLSALLSASLGLLSGTLVDPRKTATLFTVVLLPATFLGCVYYPWSALDSIRWLQVIALFNPLVYISEGLRASMTPQVTHLPPWAFLLALTAGTLAIAAFSIRAFTRKVIF
jgi:ABC-2 type transport system permease protein